MAGPFVAAAGLDAARYVEHDHPRSKFRLAGAAGRLARRRRRTPEEKGARLSDAFLRRTAPLPRLPDRRGLVCIRSARVSVGDCPARQARREALERLRRPFAVTQVT